MLVNGCARSGLAHQTTYEPPRQLDHHPSRVLPVVGPLAGERAGEVRTGIWVVRWSGWYNPPGYPGGALVPLKGVKCVINALRRTY